MHGTCVRTASGRWCPGRGSSPRRQQQPSPPPPQVEELVSFGARIGVALLLLEALTHTLYVNAITRFHAWDRVPAASGAVLFTGGTMAALAFYKLIFLWLKFLVIWRVARFYALVDGVDPPENMLRCGAASPRLRCGASSTAGAGAVMIRAQQTHDVDADAVQWQPCPLRTVARMCRREHCPAYAACPIRG